MTTNRLTDQQLDEIDAREKAATAGPWCTDGAEIYQGSEYEPGFSQWIGETCRSTTDMEQDRADAAFVAGARTDVPALVAEVRRLRDELARTNAILNGTARLAGRQETKLRELGAPTTVDAVSVTSDPAAARPSA